MGKRKATNSDEKAPSKTKMDIDGEDDSGSDDDASLLNVDFEYFDPQPAHDFHGLKTLLRQLFDVDNQLLDLSALTDLILSQPTLGSTVKCDGNESDPFAFLTVLNLHQHREVECVKQLVQYLLSRTAEAKGSLAGLKDLLSSSSSPDSSTPTAQVGLVLTERFINMPHQVVPPMYNMILEEMQWANDDGEPYQFTHYLILSKTYVEVASRLDDDAGEEDRPAKKSKAAAAAADDAQKTETFYFHPEDEVLHRHALGFGGFEYSKQGDEGASDSKRTFQEMGVRPRGHAILIERAKFEGAVKAVGEYLGGA